MTVEEKRDFMLSKLVDYAETMNLELWINAMVKLPLVEFVFNKFNVEDDSYDVIETFVLYLEEIPDPENMISKVCERVGLVLSMNYNKGDWVLM